MAEDQGRDDERTPEDDDADDNATEAASGKGEEKDERTPEELRAELKAAQDAVDRAVGQRNRYKQKLRAIENGGADDEDDEDEKPTPPKGGKAPVPDAKATARAAREVEKLKASAAEMREALVSTSIRSELIKAGAIVPDGEAGKAALARMVKLIDQSDVDVVGTDVVGADEAVADLKRDMGHLFKSERKRAGKLNGGAGKQDTGSDGKPKSSAQRLAEQFLGG